MQNLERKTQTKSICTVSQNYGGWEQNTRYSYNWWPDTNQDQKIIRIICGVHPRTHTEPLYKALHILNIDQVRDYSIALFMYKLMNHMLPSMFENMFIKTSDVHKYNNWCNASKLIAPALTTIWSQTFKMGFKNKQKNPAMHNCLLLVISVLLLS